MRFTNLVVKSYLTKIMYNSYFADFSTASEKKM